ncbi:uncharacterized protein LOC125858003 isoform X3 [Solanum stenotomum]|uniref:uncharacterized protein LOC125858003 isoform X3 n=1 Tax=Solanum stenotomum TaxID=172797 RepID=UPI0020D0B5FF|nr:uncharacterized protein LOC125858003 isoform X3 [Solanum stenotomum]
MAVATTATTHFTVLQQPQVLFAPKSRSSPDACSIYTRTFSFPSGKSRSNHHFQYHTKSKYGVLNCICCSTDSNSRRGLGPSDGNTNKGKNSVTARRQAKGTVRPQRNSSTPQSDDLLNKAPRLNSTNDVRKSKSVGSDLKFEERLQAVKRSALQQKKTEEEKAYGAIDYDAPVESRSTTIGLGTKIGVGAAVIVFGLLFALGDFLPSGSVSPTEEIASKGKRIAEDERANLLKTLQQFEATLASSPEDPISLEGAAVTLAELGEYNRASSLLEELIKKKPSDPDVYRLLGEVKYGLMDYEGSAAAFRMSAMVSRTIDFEVLRGLTNALIAARKPDEAVQMLLASASRKSLKEEKTSGSNDGTKNSAAKSKSEVDLLLGKAYSEWGHISDAVSVYNQLISTYPDDFRGYLAKGIILKENGNVGDAERMFIQLLSQARFFAPENAKALVDKYSK